MAIHRLSLFISFAKQCQYNFTRSFNFVIREAMKIMIGLRVTHKFKKFLQVLADKENRTLSGFINNAILTYIKEHQGIDWKEKKCN